MAADVVAPPSVADVGCCRREPRLHGKRLPCDDRIAREADRIAMAPGSRIPRERETALSATFTVLIMVVIEHPQRIKARHLRDTALLPVKPPEIDAILFIRMINVSESCLYIRRIRDVEGNRLLRIRIASKRLRHLPVHHLVAAHPIRRMNIERRLQTVRMKPGKKFPVVREKILVPGVAGPAAAVFRVDIDKMPVHVNNRDGQRNPVSLKMLNQVFILLLRVLVIPAPPVSECKSWNQRLMSRQMIVICKSLAVIVPIAEEIQISIPRRSGRNRPVLMHQHRMAVVDHGKAAPE